MFSEFDHAHMRRALRLAHEALYLSSPNPRVGCVLVRNDEVVGEGFTQQAGGHHAEVMALNAARSGGAQIAGSTAYVTMEPCNHFGRTPPCTEALIAAGVTRVVAAMQDPNPLVSGKGLARLRQAGIDVRCGLFADVAADLNPGFIKRMTTGLPWLRLKAAASLDGRTALPNGLSQWITGQAARDDGHHFRACACAVLTGVGTVQADDPSLTVRAVTTQRQPQRIVIDSKLQTPPAARLLASDGGPVTIVHTVRDAAREAALEKAGARLLHVAADAQGKNDLHATLHALAAEQINEIHVEAGARLNASLLAAGLVDELLIYLAPMLLGEGAGIAALPALESLDAAQRFTTSSATMIGTDVRIIARVLHTLLTTSPGK
jgi:diaminohydroxyphosphoribosylaminopyrimidine deaminase / 5-amino-6-(5-phosphoribosylamino)uracil reductase